MLPSRIKKESNSIQSYTKISNSLLECFVQKKNIIAIKIIFYIAMKNDKFNINKLSNITTLKLSISSLVEAIKTDKKTLLRNIKKIQETSITFISFNDSAEINESVSILPRVLYKVGFDFLELDFYNIVLDLVSDVQTRFTVLNASNLVQLKNIHTIKMIGLLKIIDGYSENVAKKKSYSLFELNSLFCVNYKTFYEFERKILKPVQFELDQESQISFIYNFNFESLGVGRPKIKEVSIYLKNNKARQLKMF